MAEGAWLGGVCTGLARHLGWPVMVIRIGFVALMTFQFIGVLAYGALWLLLPPEPVDSPGLEAASRKGMRDQPRPRRRIDWGMLLALAALGTGLLWIVQSSGLGISSQLFWPVAFACAGAALVWRQADSAQQKRWRAEAGGQAWLAPFVARGGWPALVRVIVGLGLVGAAFGIVIAQQSQIDQLPEVLAMTTLALAGLGVVLAPVAAPLAYRAEPGPGGQGPRRRPGRHGRAPARLGAADPGPDPAPGRRSQGRAAAGPPPGTRAADLAVRRGAAQTRRSRRR